MNYEESVETIVRRLAKAHGPDAEMRGQFFQEEYKFFRSHIEGQRVLDAGSGLGRTSYELASYNKEVIGVEILRPLVEISKNDVCARELTNVYFLQGDFRRLCFPDASFDSAVLNMCTIGNIYEREEVVEELVRVASIVYMDLYLPVCLEKRVRMYEEEGWRNVRIVGTMIVSDDGLHSESMTID